MSKLRIGMIVFAVLAFSAVAATSASAVSKILWNSEEIAALLPIEIVGSLLLEDINATGKPDILCTFVLDGMIEPGGQLIYIEDLLTSTGELLAGEGGGDLIECVDDNNVCSGVVDVEVLELPWHIEIELVLSPTPTIYLAHFLNLKEIEELGEVGVAELVYHIDCSTILGLVEDLCNGLTSARLNNNVEGLLAYFNSLADSEAWGAESEPITCTLGGAGAELLVSATLGAEEDTEASGSLVRDTGGGTLSVSE